MVKIRLPWINSILSPNSTAHWAKKIKPKKAHRQLGYDLALEAGYPPEQDTYHLSIIFYPPDNQCRDLDNCLASIKAALDGIADAWHINDKQFRPITIDFGDVKAPGKISIEVL